MPLEKVEVCPLCQDKSFSPFLVCKDNTVSGELFHVEQCTHCGMTLTNPRPSVDQAGKYYQSEEYISHTSRSTGIIDYIYLIIRQFTIKWKFRLVKPYLSNKKILDIGCGTGNFAGYCKLKNMDAYGIEPSLEARSFAQNHNIQVYESLDYLPNIKFNVITLWHVLEHIYDLHNTLDKIKSHLAEDGIIFIAVPNFESGDANHYKEFWAGYDTPRHVWHFSKKTMEVFLGQAGLKLIEKIPMKLDAFYVSLLSEKYMAHGKHTLASFFNAITVGLSSNRAARKHMNYSSIIYMARK